MERKQNNLTYGMTKQTISPLPRKPDRQTIKMSKVGFECKNGVWEGTGYHVLHIT